MTGVFDFMERDLMIPLQRAGTTFVDPTSTVISGFNIDSFKKSVKSLRHEGNPCHLEFD